MGRYIDALWLNGEAGNDYFDRLPAVQWLRKQRLRLSKDVTFLVGENGSGKSTLLEGIAVAYGFNPEGGSKNFTFSTRDTHSGLWEQMTISRRAFPKDGYFLRAESFYNLASNIDEMDEEPSLGAQVIASYGGVSLHRQSHGESFLALVRNRFGGRGVYLLDEPEAALSPTGLMTLMAEMDRLVRKESQFIIATHSPVLMAFPGAEVFEISEQGICGVDYRETSHYQITRRFLEDPERMFRYLLGKNTISG